MKKVNKKQSKELTAFAKKHRAMAMTIALTLISELEKEDDLVKRVNILQAGLMAFAVGLEEDDLKLN